MSHDRPAPMRGAERPLAGDTPYDFRERMLERMREDDLMVTDARETDALEREESDRILAEDDAWVPCSRYDSD